MMPETRVVSFVLRFVSDKAPDESVGPMTGWHGLIRHVQSGDERPFVHWEDAVAFIAQYVRVDDQIAGEGENNRGTDGRSHT